MYNAKNETGWKRGGWWARKLPLALASALIAAAVLAALATADPVDQAYKDVQNPGTIPEAGGNSDTKYTPAASGDAAKTFGWTQVGGAIMPGHENQAGDMGYKDDSSDPDVARGLTALHLVDFYTVSFHDAKNGFAAGAACADPATPADDPHLSSCARVPVIYRYSKPDPNKPGDWQQAYRGGQSTGDGKGFVGAIAWIPSTSGGEPTAVAVGGDGCYPRREEECPAASKPDVPPDFPDPIAGHGLAWKFTGGSWQRIGNLEQQAPGVTGMTALDFSVRPSSDCNATNECGFAGGKGQMWMWRDGAFQPDSPYDYKFAPPNNAAQDPTYMPAESDSPFRVRQIRFSPIAKPTVPVVAVTDGCCYTHDPVTHRPMPKADYPRAMWLTTSGWRSSGLYHNSDLWAPHPLLPRADEVGARAQTVPDSFYGVTWTQVAANTISILASPGGPENPMDAAGRSLQGFEPASRILGYVSPAGGPGGGGLTTSATAFTSWVTPAVLDTGGAPTATDVPRELTDAQLSSIRLVAGDGNQLGHKKNEPLSSPATPDGFVDWAVGDLRSSGEALAYTTSAQTTGVTPPNPLDCPGSDLPDQTNAASCKADTNAASQLKSGYAMTLPSYPLNGFAMIPDSASGWAVGDRGALLNLGGTAGQTDTVGGVKPFKAGAAQQSHLSDRRAYDAFRPAVSNDVGLVPELSSQPMSRLAAPQLVPAGSPAPIPDAGEVNAIAMSGDGSQGWAMGGQFGTTLYYFDGARWTQCDPSGVPDVLPPNPACESLTQLSANGGKDIKVLTVAALPGDGSDFQALAVANTPRQGTVVLRYRDRRWAPDPDLSHGLSPMVDGDHVELAFGEANDIWLLDMGQSASLYHLSGGTWTKCGEQSPPANDPGSSIGRDCGDPNSVLPIHASPHADYANSQFATGLHLTSVGKRVYLYGTRSAGSGTGVGSRFPVVLHEEPTSDSTKNHIWVQDFDPKDPTRTQDGGVQGILNSLSIAQGSDGSYTGWGVGDFIPNPAGGVDTGVDVRISNTGHVPLLQVTPDGKVWKAPNMGGAASEYLLPPTANEGLGASMRSRVVALPGPHGSGPAFAVRNTGPVRVDRPMVWFNPAPGHERWEVFATPFEMIYGNTDINQQGSVATLAPDNRGGIWVAATAGSALGTWFYDYTDRVHQPLFTDVPHPIREQITATSAGGDGSFWVSTASGRVYRYDRVTGWDQVTLKGWDAGGVLQSPAYAIAVDHNGDGVVVGKQGRIADIAPTGAVLDPAAVLCQSNPGNCGGGQTLRAVAVADDGSALAGGDNRTLLWRSSGEGFHAVAPPDVARGATITGIAMPTPDRAWLTLDTGDVFVGSPAGGDWRRENLDANGNSLSRDGSGNRRPLWAVSVDQGGHGYAVGDDGLILERSADRAAAWHRMDAGYGENLRSVALDPSGKGVLIGGDGGLVLTLVGDHFEVAHTSDYYDPLTAPYAAGGLGRVVGLAMMPGQKPGDVEAWAALQLPEKSSSLIGNRSPPPGALLHYTNDASDPLLSAGAGRAEPIPDAPPHQAGELDFAAFGKSDCQLSALSEVCPEFTGTNLANETIARRIRDSLVAGPDKPDFAVFTGDVEDAAGSRASNTVSGPTDPSPIHNRWADIIATPFGRGGVPLFGALGGADLSHVQGCDPVFHHDCVGTRGARTGLNLAWRQALAGSPPPWGGGGQPVGGGLTFTKVTTPTEVGADGTPVGGARTHYAFDVRRDGTKLVRVVVVDTSLKTLSGTAPVQNPVQDQLTWLDDVLTGEGRTSDELAVVVSETPSYSYNNSAGATTDTLTDSAALEALLVKDNVDAVVSGRLGWNGLYYLVAPGLHYPCPGGEYPTGPPTDATQLCQGSGDPVSSSDQLASALQSVAPTQLPVPSEAVKKVAPQLADIPVAVAASAGGKFGPDGSASGDASQGFWHGYTRVRLFPDRKFLPVIEQRPVFDWIGIKAGDHTVAPGHRLQLQGYGREPVGIDQPIRYDSINGPAITHRYDLKLADPAHPYLPKVDSTNDEQRHYVPVPADVGASIDEQTGLITYDGNGNHPPVYALAILSVGHQVATWPVVLAPKRSFIPVAPPLQRLAVLPRPRVVNSAPASIPPNPANPVPTPPQLDLTFPSPPSLVAPPLSAPQAQPPAPPAPPPPPASPAATALQIAPAPVGLNVAPPATVIPPPAPPIQPAPPSGARREARQRQAAVAKSEESGGQEGAAQESGDGDGNGTQSASTRLEPRRDDLAFTALDHRDQPSAWTRDLLYGGGLGLAALSLALGWSMLRPKPRRREPDLPAPAWARERTRRR